MHDYQVTYTQRVYSTVFFVWQEMTHGDVKIYALLHHLELPKADIVKIDDKIQ